MSGIPLTDEGVTSDGGAGETISLPPKTSMSLTPRKCKMSTRGTYTVLQKRLQMECSRHICFFLSYSVWVGCYQSNSELILFSAYGRHYFVSDAGTMSPREQRRVQTSSNYSCTQRPWNQEKTTRSKGQNAKNTSDRK